MLPLLRMIPWWRRPLPRARRRAVAGSIMPARRRSVSTRKLPLPLAITPRIRIDRYLPLN